MDFKIQNKTAIVLAASKGLGKAIAVALAKEGVNVVIGSRNENELEKTADEIRQFNFGKVLPVVVDVNNADELKNIVKIAAETFGTIDILVNNAGGPPFNSFENFNDEQWEAAFNQNMLSFVRTSRLVLPYMRQAGNGRIINIISTSVKAVLQNSVLSTSMRMAVVGMAKMLADEVAIDNITVNNVAPGLILTDRIKETMIKPGLNYEDALKEKVKTIPAGRIGKPEELAALVAFLSSQQASYITGTTIQVDGGATRSIL